MSSISVITATYNAAATLKDNLACIRQQTENSSCGASLQVEHLLIDGGSNDGTLDLIKAYCTESARHAGFISEPDQGIYDAMNKGIKMVTGDVVGILNADDFYASRDVLENVTRAFQDPSVDACYGDLCYVDSDDPSKVVRYWQADGFDAQKFYWGWMPPHPTFFVRKSVYQRYGLFDLSLGSAADYELMLRFLVRHRLRAVYIPKVLVKMRTGGVSNRTLANRLRANRMDRKAWAVNGLRPYPWTLTMKPLRKLSQWIFTKTPQEA